VDWPGLHVIEFGICLDLEIGLGEGEISCT